MRHFLSCLFLLFFLSQSVFSQIKINEVLASNSTQYADPESGDFSDWIELFNETGTDINLKGYSITDNYNNPVKFIFSEDIVLPAKGFVLVWCDDKGTGLHTNFKLSADGEEIALYNPQGVLLDSLTFGAQSLDISYARYPDGSPYWKYYLKSSPAASNDSTGYGGQVFSLPDFKIKGGIYTTTQVVEAYNDMGGTLRYTLDGSEPNDSSEIYKSPITISKTTCLRARIFKEKEIPGPVATETYFINEGFDSRKLPVVSIATNPKNFWDPSTGIYVQNFKPEWEIPVNIELFENNGSDRAGFNEKAGIKVNGLYSWQLPQKMLGVYFRKQYGVSKLDFRLFNDRPRSTFDNFALRASGNDWSNTLFRDGLIQQALHQSNMDLDNMAFRPSVVYVNGQYMGIHNIREKVDEDFVASNHGLKEGEFDLVENGDFAESGDLIAWNSFWTKVNLDLTDQANYDSVAAVFDIPNFIDLLVAEAYSGNSSIDHNTMSWKPRDGGKWRWIIMDLDRGFFSQQPISFLVNQTVWPMKQLMRNTGFKQQFGSRLANLLYTTFNPIRMNKEIDRHQKDLEPEIAKHVARWLGTTSSYGNAMPSVEYWYNEVQKLRNYANLRNSTLLTDLANNYGFSAPAGLTINNEPSGGGDILFNQLNVPESQWSGQYPKNLPVTLEARPKAGYAFKGWKTTAHQTLFSKKSTWKYLCDGTDQGSNWIQAGFDDSSWSSGNGILGYGSSPDTKLTYGSSSTNKYITYYFRSSFELPASENRPDTLILSLLRDDGAVVYLNGHEVVRSNMPQGAITYHTLASTTVSNAAETTYYPFAVDPAWLVTGTNVLAVEVHQVSASSTDLGFDLELVAATDSSVLVSTDPTYTFSLDGDQKITAVYQPDGKNILPAVIGSSMTLYKAQSPYYTQGDVTVSENATLTIEPGVTVYMAPNSNMLVHGNMLALGTAADTIFFKQIPGQGTWGALCFINTTDTTRMRYVTLKDATSGPVEYRCVSAISGWHTNLILDHMTLTENAGNPIAARYSDVTLTNSNIHSRILGDGINVKYGKGRVENCTFEGNPNPDTDAVDYDGVENGIIRNVRIHGFPGFNSDGIDIGEEARNIRIDSVFIYDITDKGISVGQRSSVIVNDATIINTNLGFGVKDSSSIDVRNSTFFCVGTPAAAYEKIQGRKGGNATVRNSILSNSYDRSYECDQYSTLRFENTLSDNDLLPDGVNNQLGNPGFRAAGYFDFYRATQPAFAQGSDFFPLQPDHQVTITDIFFNINKATDRTEFIGLLNPGHVPLDLTNFTLSKAVEFTFPAGTILQPGGKLFVVNPVTAVEYWKNRPNVFTWTDGNLANEGETVRISDASGIVQDQVHYEITAPWPDITGSDEKVLRLLDPALDNHFASSWTTVSYQSIVSNIKPVNSSEIRIYPNPARGPVTIGLQNLKEAELTLYRTNGEKVLTKKVQNGETLDLSAFSGEVLLARIAGKVLKLVLLK